MGRQLKDSWCGPAAVSYALSLMGHPRVSQRRIATLAGEQGDGCDEQDLIRALTALQCSYAEFGAYHRNEALSYLRRAPGVWPLILCVDNYDHWVCVAGGIGERLYLFDPQKGGLGGFKTLRAKTILRRWRASQAAAAVEGVPYYAIAIMRGPLK